MTGPRAGCSELAVLERCNQRYDVKPRARKLVVGDRAYWFSVGHLHDVDRSSGGPPTYRGCRERVMIRRDLPRAAPLIITFIGGSGRGVGDGLNPSGIVIRWVEEWDESSIPPGVVARTSGVVNLHRPGVARALLDEAIARGWDTVSRMEIDGWELFDAVEARLGPDSERVS